MEAMPVNPESADRVLIVTRNFLPVAGGMERLLFHCYQELSRAYRVAVVAPAAARPYVDATHFRGFALAPLAWSLAQSWWLARRMAMDFRPTLVLAGSGAMAPAAFAAARACGARAACYLHGLDLVARSLLYQSIFVRSLRHFDLLIANSQATHDLARGALGQGVRIEVLNPGVAVPSPHSGVSPGQRSFRDELGVGLRTPLLLSVGRLTERKGLIEFVRLALPRIVQEFPEVQLVVIGEEPRQALKASRGVRAQIENTACDVGVSAHLRFLGRVDDAVLARAYAECDVHVFPVKRIEGDMEGFGMVAVEAAAYGLPTVAFNEGGVADAIWDGVSGRLVASGDYPEFARVVMAQLKEQNREQWREKCRAHASGFSWAHFGQRLRSICEPLIRS